MEDRRNKGPLSAHSVARAFLSAGIVLPLGIGLNYILNVVLARALTVEGFGLFAYAQSLATVLAAAATLGFSSSMMRLVAQYSVNSRFDLLVGLLKYSVTAVLISSFLIAFVVLTVSVLLQQHRAELLWSSLLIVPFAVDYWRESAMRGARRLVSAIAPRQLLLPLASICVVLVIPGSSESNFLIAYLILIVLLEIGSLAQLGWIFRDLRSVVAASDVRSWMRISLPMAGSTLATLGLTRWDVIVVGSILGLDAVGVFAAASRTALLGSLALRVVNLVVSPLLAELFHSCQFAKFKKLVLLSALGAGLFGSPLFIVTILFPEEVMGLFGQEYESGGVLLQIMVCGQFINLITGPASFALIMSKHENENLAIVLVTAVISLTLAVWLTSKYGLVGAAVSTTVSVSLLNLTQTGAFFWLFRGRSLVAETQR